MSVSAGFSEIPVRANRSALERFRSLHSVWRDKRRRPIYFFLGFRSLFGRWLGAKSGLDQ